MQPRFMIPWARIEGREHATHVRFFLFCTRFAHHLGYWEDILPFGPGKPFFFFRHGFSPFFFLVLFLLLDVYIDSFLHPKRPTICKKKMTSPSLLRLFFIPLISLRSPLSYYRSFSPRPCSYLSMDICKTITLLGRPYFSPTPPPIFTSWRDLIFC